MKLNQGKTGTVLLADDEPLIRMLLNTIFEKCDFSILSAANGIEALELARQHEGEIDLLLTDISMPDMGGRELAQEVRKIHPQSSVLYLSGSAPADLDEFYEMATDDFICKPFEVNDLVDRVRSRISVAEPEVCFA